MISDFSSTPTARLPPRTDGLQVLIAASIICALAACGRNHLAVAVRDDDVASARVLLDRHGGTDQVDHSARLLLVAIENGNAEMVQLLVSHRADVNYQRKDGVTPIWEAVVGGHLDIVRILLDAHAPPDVENQYGVTPLMMALRLTNGGTPDLVRLLVAHGADVNHTSKLGATPLMLATVAPSHNIDLIDLLMGMGADINRKRANGARAFSDAVSTGQPETAIALLERGADPDVPDDLWEISGRVGQLLGDYFLARGDLTKARSRFEQAERGYRATAADFKSRVGRTQSEVAALEVAQAVLVVSAIGLGAAAGAYQAHQQAHQLAQISALREAARSHTGVAGYSALLAKYDRTWVPTYVRVAPTPLVPIPDGTPLPQRAELFRERARQYESLASLMNQVVKCFDGERDITAVRACVDSLVGART